MARSEVSGAGQPWVYVSAALLAAAAIAAGCGDDEPSRPAANTTGGAAAGADASPRAGAAGSEASHGGLGGTSEGGASAVAGGESSGASSAGGSADGGTTAGGAGGGTSSPFDCAPAAGPQQALQLTELSAELELPVGVAQPFGEAERLFVVELGGEIRIVKGGQTLETPFLDLDLGAGFQPPERGLVALAFHPNYAENGRFFVVYTKAPSNEGSLQLSEFGVSVDPDVAAPTEKPLLTIAQPKPNHIGRALAFGPDGNLYLATGDGGGSADELLQGQEPTGLLGKVLRIDVDGAPVSGKPYAIPTGNMPGGAPERWAFGLRHPLGLSFDGCTGDMYLADTNSNHDELNLAPAGQEAQNYGWSMYVGSSCFAPPCSTAGKTFPLYETTAAFQLHGGFVYRGSALSSFRGHYFAVDRVEQRAFAIEVVDDEPVLRDLSLDLGAELIGTQGIGQDSSGELYLTNLIGTLYRIDLEE